MHVCMHARSPDSITFQGVNDGGRRVLQKGNRNHDKGLSRGCRYLSVHVCMFGTSLVVTSAVGITSQNSVKSCIAYYLF